jgi:hypothetical protein
MSESDIGVLNSLLADAASCITDAEEAHGTFDTDHWTDEEITKRWEFWRAYWTVGPDPMPRDQWPAEYQSDDWRGCVADCGEHPAFRRTGCRRVTCAEHDCTGTGAHTACRPTPQHSHGALTPCFPTCPVYERNRP